MSVDFNEVRRIVDEALTAANRNPRFRSVTEAVESAWQAVNRRRLRGDCSANMAAAEHYLYCRFLIGRYSPAHIPVLSTMSRVYDMAKALNLTYQEGTCAPSPPTAEDRRWRNRGMADGAEDFLYMNRLGGLHAPSFPGVSVVEA